MEEGWNSKHVYDLYNIFTPLAALWTQLESLTTNCKTSCHM